MQIFLRILFFFLLVTQICFAQPVSPLASQGGWFWQNPLPQGNPLVAVDFVSSAVGCALDWNGTILRTTNGGTTLSSQTSGTTDRLCSVSFADVYMEVQMNKLLLPVIMLFTLQNLFLIHCKGGMS